VSGLDSHRRLAVITARLDPSVGRSGPRDFAVRVRHVRRRAIRVQRIPAPHIVTIGRNVPLHRGGLRETLLVICPTRQLELSRETSAV
jgi:hypothetical protein